MKPISESAFIPALKGLAETLRQREDAGLNRVIDPDAPVLLREIAEQLTDENLDEMCAKCRDILDTIGKVRNCGRMMDDFENIQAIVHHLGTLQCNLPRSTGELYEDLYRLLGEKTQFIRQKAEAFAAYLG